MMLLDAGMESQRTLFKQLNSGDQYIPTALHRMEGKCTHRVK